jgi:hypothetical protein
MAAIEGDGRWCECGGELRHARQRNDTESGSGQIATYLMCLFCGHKRLTLIYDEASGKHYGVREVR